MELEKNHPGDIVGTQRRQINIVFIHLYLNVSCKVPNKQAIIHRTMEISYVLKDLGEG